MKKKIFPKIWKKLKWFLTDESWKITKKDALWLAAITSLGVAVNDVVAAHTSSYSTTWGRGWGTGHSSYSHSNSLYCRSTNHNSSMWHGSAIVNGSSNYRFPSSKHSSSLSAWSLSGHGSATGHSSHGSSGTWSGSGTWGSCFTYSQRILTPNGLKPIGSFKKWDEVISYNHETNEYETSIVEKFIPHDGNSFSYNDYKKYPLCKVIIKTQDGEFISIESTSNHPFYDLSENSYKFISEIAIWNQLQLHKTKGTLVAIEMLVDASYWEDCDLPIVYNLHMRESDNHNYFVEWVLVHNAASEGSTNIP